MTDCAGCGLSLMLCCGGKKCCPDCTHSRLIRDVESGRKVIVDRLCQTCEGTNEVTEDGRKPTAAPGQHAHDPCPDCTDGLVPYIALTKQGGEWPKALYGPLLDIRWLFEGDPDTFFDALAEASAVEGER